MTLKLASAQETRETPQPDSLRESLRTAIADLAEVRRAQERNQAAIARASDLITDLEAKLTKAAELVGRARENQGRRVAAALSKDHQVSASPGTKAARANELAVEDELESARAALQQLEAANIELEQKVQRSSLAVEAAVTACFIPYAERLVRELEEAKRGLAERQAALFYLRSRRGVPRGNGGREIIPALAAPLQEIESRITRAIEIDIPFNAIACEQHPIARELAAICSRLRDDPDNTALPD